MLYRWVRVSPGAEAPLCGTDECVVAWHPDGGWPTSTTRPLRRERRNDPILILNESPKADALTTEIRALARSGTIQSPPDTYAVVQAAVKLILETAIPELPAASWRQVPAFRILDLARALRDLLGDFEEGSLVHHILTCTYCSGVVTGGHRMCPVGYRLYAESDQRAS